MGRAGEAPPGHWCPAGFAVTPQYSELICTPARAQEPGGDVPPALRQPLMRLFIRCLLTATRITLVKKFLLRSDLSLPSFGLKPSPLVLPPLVFALVLVLALSKLKWRFSEPSSNSVRRAWSARNLWSNISDL